MSIWKQEFSHLTIPKNIRLVKCETCIAIRAKLQKDSKSTLEEKAAARQEKHEHLLLVGKERHAWHYRMFQAKTSKDTAAIYLDGMDQNKTEIPQVKHAKHLNDVNLKPLKTRLTWPILLFIDSVFRLIGGLLYHDKAIRPFGFFFPGAKFYSDTNSNLECLRRILEVIGQLPKKLFMQLDNTCKDNKNWFLFSFLSYLLLAGFITECEVYFLLVGHTHGQIDQMFSVLAKSLKYHPAKTLPELAWALWHNFFNPDKAKRKAMVPRQRAPSTSDNIPILPDYLAQNPSVEEDKQEGLPLPKINQPKVSKCRVHTEIIDSVVDIASWLSVFGPIAKDQMRLRDSHAFKLELSQDKKQVLMYSKQYASLRNWQVVSLYSRVFMI